MQRYVGDMIRDDIKAATIAAMKGGDKETTGTLRLVSAAIKNRDIEARTGGAPVLPSALRVTLWGALAMALTYGAGALFGAVS